MAFMHFTVYTSRAVANFDKSKLRRLYRWKIDEQNATLNYKSTFMSRLSWLFTGRTCHIVWLVILRQSNGLIFIYSAFVGSGQHGGTPNWCRPEMFVLQWNRATWSLPSLYRVQQWRIMLHAPVLNRVGRGTVWPWLCGLTGVSPLPLFNIWEESWRSSFEVWNMLQRYGTL